MHAALKVRFLADADLHHAMVVGLQRCESAVDFLTAQSARLRGVNDMDVLGRAAAAGRVLVSHDVGTMPAHFAAFLAAGNRSPGLFLIQQRLDIGTAIEELRIIWSASDPADWEDRLVWLPL